MAITDIIAQMIEQMLETGGGHAELQRNNMASKLGCVPSQISYVITSRFTPERGYITESKRGGGGCIRIVKIQMDKNNYLMHFFCAIGNAIDEPDVIALLGNLKDNAIINLREHSIILSAISNNSLSTISHEDRNTVRADILRHIILTLIN